MPRSLNLLTTSCKDEFKDSEYSRCRANRLALAKQHIRGQAEHHPIIKPVTGLSLFPCGQGLQCYKCDMGFWSLCYTTKVTCGAGEWCFSGVGEAASFVNIIKKGCLAEAKCNKTVNVNFPPSNTNSTVYTMTETCCNTDLCNGAPGLPGGSGVGVALATIAALFLTRVLG
uniref:Lymphocyte antigen-6, epidermis n=1 Tax=Takifugu rubripes TaxID=31033 RepID=A0A674P419_TAKRU